MAAPVIAGVEFDKPAYAPGDTIKLTVHYTVPNTTGGDPVTKTYTFTGKVTDQATGETGTGTGTFTVQLDGGGTVPNTATAEVTGGQPGLTWTAVSDDHSAQAVFTAVIPGGDEPPPEPPEPPAGTVPVPAALATGHALVHQYDPAELYGWRYLPGTTTPPTNGSGAMADARSPRNVSVANDLLTLATTNANDCGDIQSPVKFPTDSGVIEAKVKLSGNGAGAFAAWAALWMYGDRWPDDGEIDAVETMYGNNFVAYHYGTGGDNSVSNYEANTDPWTYDTKKVQLQPKNTTSKPTAPNILPDVWTVVDLAFGTGTDGSKFCDVYYNGTLYCHIAGAYVTGHPMYLVINTGFGAGTLGSAQTAYDVPANVQIQYVRVFS